VRQLLWVDQALDRLIEGNAGRDENDEHDGEAGQLLAPDGAQVERDPEWQCRQGVTEVVDQIGQQSNRAREDEDRHLNYGSKREDSEAERDGLDTCARTHDRPIDEPVRVAVPTSIAMLVLMRLSVRLNGL
jgi:hypothetical protein